MSHFLRPFSNIHMRRAGIVLSLSALIALAAFVTIHQFSVSAAPDATAKLRSGSVGVAQGQTVRVSVANTGKKDLTVTMTLFDEQGLALFLCNELFLKKGYSYSMDLNGDTIADKAPARRQVRYEIKVKNSDSSVFSELRHTLEVFDNITGQTSLIYAETVH